MSISRTAQCDVVKDNPRPRFRQQKLSFWRPHSQICVVCIFIFCSTMAAQSAGQSVWTKEIVEQGITVWIREQSGHSLPEFRGRGQIRGELFHAVAVILDNKRSHEWVPNCKESREIKRIDGATTLVYSVSDSPWPVSDRDTVVRVVVEAIEPDHAYRIFIRAQPDVLPPVDGRVRIPYSEIYFLLRRVNAGTTEVEYGLDVDPGGALPKWMVRWTARNILIDTIRALEIQITKTREYYPPGINTMGND